MSPTVAHWFCGLGGASLGYQQAGFRCVGAFDLNRAACEDHLMLAGHPAQLVDLAEIQPRELAALHEERPDVIAMSPPCKGFSGCLPLAMSKTQTYQDLNSLVERSICLAVESWKIPPPFIILENVPRITTRGRQWLDNIEAILRAYGYACRETIYDCGEFGGLAQHRRRFLLVARHVKQMGEYVAVPQLKRVRGIGEVLSALPVPLPGSTEGGPLHRLPKCSAMNWMRLALIPAGGDWRDLPESVALAERAGRQNGGFGVEDWDDASYAVVSWNDASPTVRGAHEVRIAPASVADPRSTCKRNEGSMGVRGWEDASHAIIGHAAIQNFSAAVADPRLTCSPRATAYGVVDWDDAVGTVLSAACHDNSGVTLADPRATHDTSHTLLAVAGTYHGPADPRTIEHVLVGDPIDLDSQRPCYLIIRAPDGTWHRPMTTLELAVLQGLPATVNGEWLRLSHALHPVAPGKKQPGLMARWRERIGNAVPPPAAKAMAEEIAEALAISRGSWRLRSPAMTWVQPEHEAVAT